MLLFMRMLKAYLYRSSLMLGALAVELTEDDYKALDAARKPWYTKNEEGAYELDPSKIEIDPLLTAVERERDNAKREKKAREEMAEKFKDVDPEKYREIMHRLDADDEGRLIKEGKMDEVWSRRTAKLNEEHARQMKAKDEAIVAEQQKTKKFEQRVLDNALMEAATKGVDKNRVVPSAIDDILLHGRQVFALDDDGNAVMKDKDGNIIMSKDPNKPFGPSDWLAEQIEKRGHWFEYGSSGGGASPGNGSGQPTGRTIKRDRFMQMTPQEQHDTVVTKGIQVVD